MNARELRAVTVKVEGGEAGQRRAVMLLAFGGEHDPGLMTATLQATGRTNAEALAGAFAKACAFVSDLEG